MIGAVYAAEGSDAARLIEVAREFSPRIEACGPREVTLDVSGLTRLFGDARTIAAELRRTAADRGLRVRVAMAGSRTAARLLVRHQAGLTVVEAGAGLDAGPADAAALAPLALDVLTGLAHDLGAAGSPEDAVEMGSTFRRWGLRTLGDLAALPADEVAARLGRTGSLWQRLARGEDPRPLVPAVPEERFEQGIDLEWPIEGLEPLSFVLGRLMEPLSAHLERRDRGAAVLHVRLHLVTRTVHERSLQLPTAIRDARTLRTLALLDLESHPPGAAIDRVVVAVDPTPGRVLQYSLLARPLPSPEQVSTLMARLHALMGEGRCGSPVAVDSWQPGAFAMKPFAPVDATPAAAVAPNTAEGLLSGPAVALRRFRFPVPARVSVEQGRPLRVLTDRRGLGGGRVETSAGPWRTSGGWWTADEAVGPGPRRVAPGEAGGPAGPGVPWDRDEWDVTLSDGATYRLFRERHAEAWFIDGIVD